MIIVFINTMLIKRALFYAPAFLVVPEVINLMAVSYTSYVDISVVML